MSAVPVEYVNQRWRNIDFKKMVFVNFGRAVNDRHDILPCNLKANMCLRTGRLYQANRPGKPSA